MLVEINSKKLSKALRIAKKIALKRNTAVPATAGVLLEAKDNILQIKSTNLEISFCAELSEVSIGTVGAVVVDAAKLSAIVDTYDRVDLTLKTTKKGLAITSGGSTQVLASSPTENFPKFHIHNEIKESITVATKDFASMLKRTSFLVSEVENKPHLSGINIQVKDGILSLFATDTLRVSTASIGVENTSIISNQTVPRVALSEIIEMLSEDEKFSLGCDDRNYYFRCGEFMLSSLLIAQKYPNLCVMFFDDGTEVLINRKEWQKALTRTLILADKVAAINELTFNKDTLAIKVDDTLGSSDQVLEITQEGTESFSSLFKIRHLTEFLTAINPSAELAEREDLVKFIYNKDKNKFNLIEVNSPFNAKYALFPVQMR